ncbi:MAG: hypothetical protein AAF799_04180 [Myxococcota bacterium]
MTLDLEFVAIGARTPVGLTAQTSTAAIRAGVSRLREFSFIAANGKPVVLGTDPLLDDRIEGRDRMRVMLESALDQALAKIGPHLAQARTSCDVLLALPETRPGFSDPEAQWMCQVAQVRLHQHGIACNALLAGRGHAGALAAVEQATRRAEQRRQAGEDAVFVIAGADSYHDARTLLWLESEQRLAMPTVRNGFTPGEAAGALVLTTKAIRRSLGLPCLASLDGVGLAREALLRDSDTGSFGQGLSHAVSQAAHALSTPTWGRRRRPRPMRRRWNPRSRARNSSPATSACWAWCIVSAEMPRPRRARRCSGRATSPRPRLDT